jgi:RimJ/RimL family protein N-acetyltransferase
VSKITTWVALNEHVTQIRIVEKFTTGIGPDVMVYFMDKNQRVWNEMDITDVDNLVNVMFTESIETDRFVLRVPRSTDGAAVHDAVADVIAQLRAWPGSWPWAVQEQSVAVSTAHCERARGILNVNKMELFVFDRETEQVVGNAEFHTIHSELNMWELGFWTRTSQQRQGTMTEALTALVGWMKQNNPGIEILTKHDVNNVASIKMMEKVGFESVGVYQIDGFTIKMYSSNSRG